MTLPWPTGAHALQIGDLLIDLRYRRLVSADGSVELQQRIFDLLLLLISEPDKLFTRQELFDRLWAGLVVDDSNLSQSIWLLRKALGEARREWIRTIAKRGYVFHPPGPVQWLEAMPSANAYAQPATGDPQSDIDKNNDATQAADAVSEVVSPEEASPRVPDPLPAAPPIPDAAPEQRRRGLPMLAGAALVLAAIVVAVWAIWTPVGAPVAVALMQVQTRSDADVPWASELLRQWSGWKLEQLPQVRLLSSEDLASGKDVVAPRVVLLSAVRSGAAGQLTLRARIQQDGRDHVFEKTVDTAGVPAAIDTLSRQLVSDLVPGQSDHWPALEVDSDAAQHYAAVSANYERGDWRAVQEGAKDVLTRAPRFGLMHMQLAIAQSNLGENLDAVRHMEIAGTLLTPLPEAGRLSLQALQLEVDPRRAREAEKAMRALVTAHPAQASYQRRYVRLLITTGQYRKAIGHLEQTAKTEDPPIHVRYERALAYSDAYYGLGDIKLSQEAARTARRIAETAGPSMRTQASEAALLEARAKATADPAQGGQAYRQAAQLLRDAGLQHRAEYAEVLAIVHVGQVAHDSGLVNSALQRALRAGDLALAADIQVTLANLSPTPDGRLHWLREALQSARSLGNLNMQGEIEAELALEDFVELRLSQAQARATQMQALGLEGTPGIRVNLMLSRIFEVQGHLRDAARASDLALQASPAAGEHSNSERVEAACQGLRVNTLLGTRDTSQLSSECGRADDAPSRFTTAWSKAEVALLLNDTEAARTQYQMAKALVDNGDAAPHVLGRQLLDVARLRVAMIGLRMGDIETATRMVSVVQAAEAGKELPLLHRAWLAVLQAELDARQGDWAASRQQASRARDMLPEGERELRQRLKLLQIADDQRHARPAEALSQAKQLYAQAGREGDVRTQQQVASLMSASDRRSFGAVGTSLEAGRRALPGASMAWLMDNEGVNRDRLPTPMASQR